MTRRVLLLASDCAVQIEDLRATLQFADFEVICAHTTAAVRQAMGKQFPEVVLMSAHQSKDFDGMLLCAEIAARKQPPMQRLVMIAADSDPATLQAIGQLGADACLVEPVHALGLLETIQVARNTMM